MAPAWPSDSHPPHAERDPWRALPPFLPRSIEEEEEDDEAGDEEAGGSGGGGRGEETTGARRVRRHRTEAGTRLWRFDKAWC